MSADTQLPKQLLEIARTFEEKPTTPTLRGFGFVYLNGYMRAWYIDPEGIKRWAVGDQPVEQS
jgi:hypothetical protein